jgi:hypothetical protein
MKSLREIDYSNADAIRKIVPDLYRVEKWCQVCRAYEENFLSGYVCREETSLRNTEIYMEENIKNPISSNGKQWHKEDINFVLEKK